MCFSAQYCKLRQFTVCKFKITQDISDTYLEAVNCFLKKTPSKMFDWDRITPLYILLKQK